MDFYSLKYYGYFRKAYTWNFICFLIAFLVYGLIIYVFKIPIFEQADSSGKLFLYSVALTYPVFCVIALPAMFYQAKRQDWRLAYNSSLFAVAITFMCSALGFVIVFDDLSKVMALVCLAFFSGGIVYLGHLLKHELEVSGKILFKEIFLLFFLILVVAMVEKILYEMVDKVLDLFQST